jgi:hypothetical protein
MDSWLRWLPGKTAIPCSLGLLPRVTIEVATLDTLEVATSVMIMINNIVNLTLLIKGWEFITQFSKHVS